MNAAAAAAGFRGGRNATKEERARKAFLFNDGAVLDRDAGAHGAVLVRRVAALSDLRDPAARAVMAEALLGAYSARAEDLAAGRDLTVIGDAELAERLAAAAATGPTHPAHALVTAAVEQVRAAFSPSDDLAPVDEETVPYDEAV